MWIHLVCAGTAFASFEWLLGSLVIINLSCALWNLIACHLRWNFAALPTIAWGLTGKPSCFFFFVFQFFYYCLSFHITLHYNSNSLITYSTYTYKYQSKTSQNYKYKKKTCNIRQKRLKYLQEKRARPMSRNQQCEVQKIKIFNYCIYYVCIGRQKHVSQGKCWKEGLRKYWDKCIPVIGCMLAIFNTFVKVLLWLLGLCKLYACILKWVSELVVKPWYIVVITVSVCHWGTHHI